MINFFDLPEYLQYSLVFINLLILAVNVYCVIISAVFESKERYRFINGLLLVLTAGLFAFSTGANFEYRKISVKTEIFAEPFGNFTIGFIIALMLLLAASLLLLYSVNRWKKLRINPGSIKEGVDRLPAGLCYHNEQGVPKLINYAMDNFCYMITGTALLDANEFWQRISCGIVVYGNTVEKTGNSPIITTKDGTTLSFTKIEREIGGKKMYEIRATDITKQFALNIELQKSNNELLSLNRRLKEYGENVWDITREREILTAKVNIHDMLGKALLVTKRYIECKETNITKEELKELWQGTLYLFDGGFTESHNDSSLVELYDAANLMGISLKVIGHIPKDNRLLRFIMSGARECLTNAVHHARASELCITLYERHGVFIIEYTNDGIKPEKEISEGGGLSSLRQSVEKDGGIMETQITPQFILRLKIPTKEINRCIM